MYKTALVHDWLVSIGGAEKVLKALWELYPSPIYTLLQNAQTLSALHIDKKNVHSSFIQKMPFSSKGYRNYLPLFPIAVEQFDLSSCDVVISSSHAVAKGALTSCHQLHICYCYSPMRYAWDLYHTHMEKIRGFKNLVARSFLHYLRNWDIGSINRVDHFVAISQFIAKRIQKIYNRKAAVIYPPVATHLFSPQKKENFYVTLSRLVPYKRVDLIVEAFSLLPDQKLVVIGDGPELKKIQQKAKNNITFLGHLPDETARDYLARAKGFVFAAMEDFGIAPVEAQAAGTPVLAYGAGGVLETVIPGKTGLFFEHQRVESLIEGIKKFEKIEFDSSFLQAHAQKFSEERFKKEIEIFIEQKWRLFCENRYSCRW